MSAQTTVAAKSVGVWVSKNWKWLAAIGIPSALSFAGGAMVQSKISPSSQYNSGGAPIVLMGGQNQASDPFTSITNMFPMMMMMMMLPQMMKGFSSGSD